MLARAHPSSDSCFCYSAVSNLFSTSFCAVCCFSGSAAADKAETDAAIVDNLEAGFAETKHCRNEQQRQEHGIGLALVAPERGSRMIARIGKRLGIHWGTRSFDQAIDRRAKFKADVELQKVQLKPGDLVLSHGATCRRFWSRLCGL